MRKVVFLCLLVPLAALAGCCGGNDSTATVRGCGVIMQSEATKAPAHPWIPPYLKEVDPADLAPGGIGNAIGTGPARAPIDLTVNIAFFYLSWDKSADADQYQVLYGGNVVWDSNNPHDGDPTYDMNSPTAYLDLDQANELKDVITAAGSYAFRIVALNSGSEIRRYPEITLSLGMVLTDFPAVGYANTPTQRIIWTPVAGAGGYRVQVYSGDWATRLQTSGDTLLPAATTSHDLATGTYTNEAYYRYKVDAHALNAGATVEIVRAIDGFAYIIP